MTKKDKVNFVIKTLNNLYPEIPVPLDHRDPYTLLIAVLLSAQCTDVRVNQITPILFSKADNPYDMIKMSIEDIKSIIRPCGLSNFEGKKLVLFFYPKASTPGCTLEACNLSENYSRFVAQGYDVLGVSADSPKRQSNFKNKYEFPYDLLADEDKSVINAYGVWGPKKFMGREYDGIHRITFVIDEKGVIEDIITKVKTKEHTAQILK